jgi:ligand-binding sensor domain-containing protein
LRNNGRIPRFLATNHTTHTFTQTTLFMKNLLLLAICLVQLSSLSAQVGVSKRVTATKKPTSLITKASNPTVINDLLVDENKIIWLSTTNGLVRYDVAQKTSKVFNAANSGIGATELHSMAKRGKPDNTLDIGTYDDGLVILNPTTNTFARFNSSNSVLPNEVRAVQVDAQNQLWIGTGVGLFKQTTSTAAFEPIALPADLVTAQKNKVWTLLAEQNVVWVSASNVDKEGVLLRYDKAANTFTNLGSPFTDGGGIASVFRDSQKRLWVTNRKGTGVAYLDANNRWQNFADAIKTQRVCQDNSGKIWTASAEGDVRFLENNTWTTPSSSLAQPSGVALRNSSINGVCPFLYISNTLPK